MKIETFKTVLIIILILTILWCSYLIYKYDNLAEDCINYLGICVDDITFYISILENQSIISESSDDYLDFIESWRNEGENRSYMGEEK